MLRPVSVAYSRELVKICIEPVSPGAGRFVPAESVATRPLREVQPGKSVFTLTNFQVFSG